MQTGGLLRLDFSFGTSVKSGSLPQKEPSASFAACTVLEGTGIKTGFNVAFALAGEAGPSGAPAETSCGWCI